jgi:hypothetical protein
MGETRATGTQQPLRASLKGIIELNLEVVGLQRYDNP